MRKILAILFSVLALAAPAAAQVSGPPYVFVNGTAANADEVNADFAAIYSAALNRTGGTMTGTLNVLQLTPVTSNLYDLGTSSFFFRTAYLKTSAVLGQTTANYTLTWANPASARAISIADPGGTDVFTFNAATQTLTNKTLTAPVLSGTATGTYTLAGTPTITAPAISSPVFSGTASGVLLMNTGATAQSHTFTGAPAVGLIQVNVTNTADSTTNEARVFVGTDGATTGIFLHAYPASFTPSTFALANGGAINHPGAGGISIMANNAVGALRFITGGTAVRWGINAAGDTTFGASAHIADSNGTPTINACGTGSPSVAGNDYAMKITIGSVVASCDVNFGHTFSTAPVCVVSVPGGGQQVWTNTTTSVLSVFSSSYPTLSTQTAMVLCRGY